MLLITNKSVTTEEQALLIYQIYLKRSRIETVFKFLKEGLGWEDMQLRNFLGIQRLLSFCFFIAAYLYKIGDQEAHDDYVILLARLGGGKKRCLNTIFYKVLKLYCRNIGLTDSLRNTSLPRTRLKI